jgi:rod shape-determining protein MreC
VTGPRRPPLLRLPGPSATRRPAAVRPPLTSVLVAAALTLILVGKPGAPLAGALGRLRSTARAAFVPAEAAGAAAFRPLAGIGDGLGRSGDLVGARAELGRAREQAASETARAQGLEAENARLAALLHLDGPAAGDGVVARVVSVGPGGAGDTLLLDRGGDSGIAVGMPVLAAGGLVGRIVDVSPRNSTVLPVTAPTSAVGVRAVPVGVAGVAQGRGGPALRLELLDPGAPVHEGDLAVTSGLRHSRFPAGLAVGRVTGGPGHIALGAFAPPDRLEVVKVLRWRPEP